MLHMRNLRVLMLGDRDAPILTEQLRSMGVKDVYAADNLVDAIGRQRREPAQLLILGNPAGNIEDLFLECRDSPPLDQLPTIVCTRSHDPEVLRRLVDFGCCGLLRAPPDQGKLRLLLRNYMRRSNLKEVYQLLRRTEFFADFTNEELGRLSTMSFVNHYKIGETIIHKGDPGDCMYVCLTGSVEILIGRQDEPILQLHVGEGQSFGETAILDPGVRTAYCIAASDCDILEISAELLSEKDCMIRLKIFAELAKVLSRRVRASNQMLEEKEARTHTDEANSNQPAIASDADVTETDADEDEFALNTPSPSPLAQPMGMANSYDDEICSIEEYDVLKRKIQLRSEFLRGRIPSNVREGIANKLVGYWTGGKLSKINPHILWPRTLFITGAPNLKNDMHLVVCCHNGVEAFEKCYLNLTLSHQLMALPGLGCAGTFLATEEDVSRYLAGRYLNRAVTYDMRMTLTRVWQGEPCIEYLTHTKRDVRAHSLFLIYDTPEGTLTRMVREAYPRHQIITVVHGLEYDPDSHHTVLQQPEIMLKEQGLLRSGKDDCTKGYYQGETFFLPDFSCYYNEDKSIGEWGALFGTIGIIAQIGPDRSGVVWGSKGGSAGALRAARARFGLSGAASPQDLAEAIAWADNN